LTCYASSTWLHEIIVLIGCLIAEYFAEIDCRNVSVFKGVFTSSHAKVLIRDLREAYGRYFVEGQQSPANNLELFPCRRFL